MRDRSLGAPAVLRQFLCLVLALFALVLQTGRVSSPATLVAACSFNEGSSTTSDDRSVNDRVATLNGAAWTTRQYGSGVLFDGIDDMVLVADANSLDLSSAFTIEAWVGPEVSKDIRPLVRKDAVSRIAYGLSLTADSKPRVEIIIGGTSYSATGATVLADLTPGYISRHTRARSSLSGSMACRTASHRCRGRIVRPLWGFRSAVVR
jgi:hypothetical protein